MTVVSHGVNLPGIARLEGTDFQFDEQMAAKEAVVEDEVDVVVFAANGDPPLPRLKAKARAELEEEGLEMVEECGLEIAFEIVWFFGQPGEFENVRVANQVGDLARHFERLRAGVFDDGFLVGGKSGTLVEERADLALELTDGPISLETFVFVESAFPRIFQADELDQVGPGESE